MSYIESILPIKCLINFSILGPFDQPSITTIKLTNPTDSTQLFKIKTTAPKKYCVRPNVGAVKPNSNTLIDSKYLFIFLNIF